MSSLYPVCSSSEDLSDFDHLHTDGRESLRNIHREIYNLSSLENFKEGWRVIDSRNSRAASIAYKALAASGGIFAVSFSGTSTLFGVLAGIQGIEDYRDDVNPFVIGHFSEWTMQGLFSLSIYVESLREVALLGGQEKARKIFHRVLQNSELSQEERQLIYEDYLAFFKNLPQNYFVAIPQLPILPKDLPLELPHIMSLDYELRESYINIEKKLLDASTLKDMRQGWNVIRENKSCLTRALIKTFMVSAGLFITLQLANYSSAIYWAGKQSLDDYQEGVNPNVGGHSLEWSVEALATANLILCYMNELANVGRVQTIVDIFEREIETLQESDPLHSEKVSRLYQHMGDRVRKISSGWFFNIPTWKLYEGERLNNQEV